MRRVLPVAVLLSALLLVAGGTARADEPAKPTGVKKPATPPPAEGGDQLKPPGKEKPKPDEPSEEEKILERITSTTQAATKRLRDKDAGTDTQDLQRKALKDIDELLKRASNPPPPDKSSQQNQQPMGGQAPMGGQKPQGSQSQGGASSAQGGMGQKSGQSLSRRERRMQGRGERPGGTAKQPGGGSPMAGGTKPMGGDDPMGTADAKPAGGGKPGEDRPAGEIGKRSDRYKDVWGHLPEKMRQEMDLYYREQFMPRYNDLLKQYFATVAEKDRKPRP